MKKRQKWPKCSPASKLRGDKNTCTVLMAMISVGLNIYLASHFLENCRLEVPGLIMGLCILFAAPCHYFSPLSGSHGKPNAIIWSCIATLISVATVILCSPYILFAIILEICASVACVQYLFFNKLGQFIERIQEHMVHDKLEDQIGWLHYPVGRAACALYYSVLFILLSIDVHHFTSSAGVTSITVLLALACLLLCTIYFSLAMIFSKDTLTRNFFLHEKNIILLVFAGCKLPVPAGNYIVPLEKLCSEFPKQCAETYICS